LLSDGGVRQPRSVLVKLRNGSSPGVVAAVDAVDMDTLKVRQKVLVGLAALLLLAVYAFAETDEDADDLSAGGAPAEIIKRFVEATEAHEDSLRGVSMQVDIQASIVKLKENATLKALRKISKVGQVSYHVLSFQGNNTVKNDVIARYLNAEQQGQGDSKLAISPTNYKFKFKGKKDVDGNGKVYVFQLSPRKKRVGLFKGEMWLDAETCLPVMEKGRLVKNPSIWFKKVEFERDFAIQNGVAIPQRMSSKIQVRLIGLVNLDINYSNFVQNADDSARAAQMMLAGAASN
jgi:hypothetical protein